MDKDAEEAEIKALQAELEGLNTEQAEQTDDTSDFFPEASPEPEAEPEPEADPVDEPAAEEPADEPEQTADEEPVPQKFVPQKALHAQREKNKEVTAENQALQLQLAELKGQMASFTEAINARKQEAQPAAPVADPNAFVPPSDAELAKMQEDEPMKWVQTMQAIADHKNKQLIEAQGAQLAEIQNTVTETVSAYEKEQKAAQEHQQQAQQEQAFLGAIQANNAAMRQMNPDYDQVYTQYHQMRVRNEMAALGVDETTANQRVHMMERQEAASALANDMSPASYWYGIGKQVLSMQPQAPTAAPQAQQAPAAPAPNGKPNPATIAKGMASGGGVASAASGGAGTSQSKTLAAIAEMSEDKLFELEQSGKLAELMGDWDN